MFDQIKNKKRKPARVPQDTQIRNPDTSNTEPSQVKLKDKCQKEDGVKSWSSCTNEEGGKTFKTYKIPKIKKIEKPAYTHFINNKDKPSEIKDKVSSELKDSVQKILKDLEADGRSDVVEIPAETAELAEPVVVVKPTDPAVIVETVETDQKSKSDSDEITTVSETKKSPVKTTGSEDRKETRKPSIFDISGDEEPIVIDIESRSESPLEVISMTKSIPECGGIITLSRTKGDDIGSDDEFGSSQPQLGVDQLKRVGSRKRPKIRLASQKLKKTETSLLRD